MCRGWIFISITSLQKLISLFPSLCVLVSLSRFLCLCISVSLYLCLFLSSLFSLCTDHSFHTENAPFTCSHVIRLPKYIQFNFKRYIHRSHLPSCLSACLTLCIATWDQLESALSVDFAFTERLRISWFPRFHFLRCWKHVITMVCNVHQPLATRCDWHLAWNVPAFISSQAEYLYPLTFNLDRYQGLNIGLAIPSLACV